MASMNNRKTGAPILSICIPTCKREDILRELINSIAEQNVEKSLYEICITDNSESDETQQLIEKEFSSLGNLHYEKVDCKGFMNSIEALKRGKGSYLKLHNDYSIFYPHALERMINVIKNTNQDDTNIFFSLGALNWKNDNREFYSYDEFMNNISYQATWSSAFGIWKKDFDSLINEGIAYDYMFPHTSFLHELTSKSSYIVDDFPYCYSAPIKKKGGYNLVNNFVGIYLSMVKEDLLKKRVIASKTYQKIENDILQFCAKWMYIVKDNPMKYTFSFENDEIIVMRTCGRNGLQRYKREKKRAKMSYYKMILKRKIKSILVHYIQI